MDSFNDVLDAAKEYCRVHTADAAYEYYISGLKAVSFENSNCVTLSVRNDFIRQIVSDRYTALLKEAFKSVLGFDISGLTATEPNIQVMGGLMEEADDAQHNNNLDGSNQVVDVTESESTSASPDSSPGDSSSDSAA